MNFRFACSSDDIYLASCTVPERQYTGPMVTRFKERFNQCKSNVNLYSQGVRGLIQEKMISQFLDFGHNGFIDDIYVKIIDHCDPNDKDKKNNSGFKHYKQCIYMN